MADGAHRWRPHAIAACVVAVCCGAGTAGALASSEAMAPVASCASIIGEAAGPRVAGRRLVLGRVSVPPALLQQDAVALAAGAAWPYWFKVGMVVRSGLKKVTIAVPPEWRSRVAIGWGSARGGQTAVVFEGCPDSRARWFAYAGGFYLDTPSMCVPLIVKVGTQSAVARFGIGTPCE